MTSESLVCLVEGGGLHCCLGSSPVLSPFRFLRLWIAVLVIYPTNQAVIALTFSNYVLQPLFPTCFPPDSGLRILAGICLCKCHLGLAIRMASFSLPGSREAYMSLLLFLFSLLFFFPCYFTYEIQKKKSYFSFNFLQVCFE